MIQNKTLYFPTWAQKGITQLHHLFEIYNVTSFNTLIQKYGVREQFLKYQQLRLLIKNKTTLTNNTLQPSQLIEELDNFKKLAIISNQNTTITLPTAKWETLSTGNTFFMTNNTNLQHS